LATPLLRGLHFVQNDKPKSAVLYYNDYEIRWFFNVSAMLFQRGKVSVSEQGDFNIGNKIFYVRKEFGNK
jgi:cytochrome b subunit of formate dehydrogenase